MSGKRLIVLTGDVPHPPNHGHKVDQFHRWQGFAAAGWRLRLICWRSPQDAPTSEADVAALAPVFEHVDVLEIPHGGRAYLHRLARLPRFPSHVASRIPAAAVSRRLVAEARAFAPAAVVLDGLYGGVLGERIARACSVPVVLRGHNVEHLYFAQQARAARRARDRLAWTVACLGLRRYECALVRRVAWTFDVSADDVAFWQAQGVARISWSPTVFPDTGPRTVVPPASKAFDVAYIGNLRLPNNLRGLAWFVDEVLPHLRRARPGTTLCFAGASPGAEARRLFERAPEIVLVPDAPSADAILSQGRVLVNPILSGSGINVKSIEMLRYDAPIVTTRIGVQGFDREIANQFVVRDHAADFADAIVSALANPEALVGRAAARVRFGDAGLASQMALIEQVANRSATW